MPETPPIHNPHDSLFKHIYSRPPEAYGLARAYGPAALERVVDWEKLVLQPGSFISDDLRHSHSDLLFSAPFAAEGSEAYIYFLFDHRSTAAWSTPLDLWGYMHAVLKRHRATHPKESRLPPLIAYLVHQGPECYPYPTTLDELFVWPDERAREGLAPYCPSFKFVLIDLPALEPSRLLGTALGRLVLDLMRAARVGDVLDMIHRQGDMLGQLLAARDEMDLLRTLLLYLLETASGVDYTQIGSALRMATSPELEKRAMTIAEELIERGKDEGIRLGEARGKDEGIRIGALVGQIRVLQKLLKLPLTPETELAGTPLVQLEALATDLEFKMLNASK